MARAERRAEVREAVNDKVGKVSGVQLVVRHEELTDWLDPNRRLLTTKRGGVCLPKPRNRNWRGVRARACASVCGWVGNMCAHA